MAFGAGGLSHRGNHAASRRPIATIFGLTTVDSLGLLVADCPDWRYPGVPISHT